MVTSSLAVTTVMAARYNMSSLPLVESKYSSAPHYDRIIYAKGKSYTTNQHDGKGNYSQNKIGPINYTFSSDLKNAYSNISNNTNSQKLQIKTSVTKFNDKTKVIIQNRNSSVITINAGCGVSIPRTSSDANNKIFRYEHRFNYTTDTSNDPIPGGGTDGYLVVYQDK